MNTHWQNFLESQGASLDTSVATTAEVQFPNQPLEADCALCALGSLGVIDINGRDATDFLQGQFSNDLRELSAEHSQLSSHCNAKGRMLANFRVLRQGEGYRILLPREHIATLLPRLKMFVLRSQVTLTERSDALVCIGLLGECLSAPLQASFGALPENDNNMVRQSDIPDNLLIRIPGSVPRWLLVGTPEMAQTLWQSGQASGAAQAGSDLWALHDIRAGLPTLSPATRELFVPQMANMHLIDGVSFHKGCYTGQEVVARMQYLGKLKRRMYLGEVPGDEAPAPGSALHSAGSRSEQGAGTVVDAQRNAQGMCELLAVAEIAAVERDDLTLAATGTPIHLHAPPYGWSSEAPQAATAS
ncbi:YgfZ/GcvT domain-containing protein [Rhabdochromatium marinum]|uniref:CAF17-like 4Fe-4S cluster assembly/insertion protein YgfZ n=1 Tax=Rhabdochromatium marinum TaxID=48729 RepID=UPI0019075C6D|nr:folate-binding protein YgfZ [Rhabdochromatium marinum]MBK1648544.1 folate-binding protein YgfZ [Rhabdochromatium marinum]